MISHDYKCIFIHVPKTAGQSIEQFFLNLHGLSWRKRGALLLRHNPDPSLGPERLAHLTAREYVECGHLSAEQFQHYYKFSFVRNPWARLVSEYRFRHALSRVSFRQFVLTEVPTEHAFSDDQRHLLPQYDFLHDAQGALLVDFVGRFEKLQADFDAVCAALNLSGDTTLPRVNAASKPRSLIGRLKRVVMKAPAERSRMHYTEYYDDELVKMVGDRYAKTIDAFGYKFGD